MPSESNMGDTLENASTQPRSKNRKDRAEELIKHYIQTHRIEPKEKLPSVRTLSDHLGVTRDSTWRALRALQEAGWLFGLPNRRYAVSEEVYTKILSSLSIRVIFAGDQYIQFAGFRRLADALERMCAYYNLNLAVTLVPYQSQIPDTVWDGCDVLLVDSDTSAQLLEQFDEFNTPVIGLDAVYSDRYYANIVTDHLAGGSMVAEYYIEHGAENVCVPYFKDSETNPRVKSRVDGFTQTWLESGRSTEGISTAAIPWSENNLQLSLNVKEYLESATLCSNYFVSDGRLAVSFLDVCDFLSIKVPDTIKMIGYDGTQVGETTTPPMTTIQQDMKQMAAEAVKLIRMIPETSAPEGKDKVIRLRPRLVTRKSA